MALILKDKEGRETRIDGKTGEILSVDATPGDLVEVEAVKDHQNAQGAFCPKGRDGGSGARYYEMRMRAMDLVHRGIVKLVEAKHDAADEPEVKMSEPEDVHVSPAVASKPKAKK